MTLARLALLAAFLAGSLAYCIARRCGLPAWESWRSGDAFDIGLMTAILVLVVCRFAVVLAGCHVN